jgi:hypothetical protein
VALDGLPEKGPDGWYESRPQPFSHGAEALWYGTMDRSALALAGGPSRRVRFLDGDDPS